ncbi:30S ribosomal protein S16 [Buchnera aphidicola]|uniref:30S ribosomal protein S16 n=1 Tax=Buchnera aphidicola TaxID=9 RepID=UPI0031B88DB5
MVIIRLARHGCKKKPFYKIVVADTRFPRNGRFIEKIGYFNPIKSKKKNNIFINIKKLKYWKKIGVKITSRIKYLINKIKEEKL